MVFPLCLNGAFAGVTSVFKSVLMSGLFLDPAEAAQVDIR